MTPGIQLRARSNLHYVYSGRSILVTDLDGWARAAGTEGFYYLNTRVLSVDSLRVQGVAPRPASVSPVGSRTLLAYYELEATGPIPERTVYLEVRRRVEDGLRTELRFTNHGGSRLAFDVALGLAADFADSAEAEQGERLQQAEVCTRWCHETQQLEFQYAHPLLDRSVTITVESASGPARFDEGALHLAIDLESQATTLITLLVEPRFDGVTGEAPTSVYPAPATPLRSVRRAVDDAFPRLTAANAAVQRAWDTALHDLSSLPLGLDFAPAAPSAGLPLYQQFFGRDTLTISWQALLAGPRLLRDSLIANAHYQGTVVDDWLDEEPGKMIHQLRWGPTSALGIDPFTRYYGDWATPVDFLAMLGEYFLWTGDRETVAGLLPAARRVLDWIERYGDPDGDGFLEYQTHSPQGVKHQGWKDSHDAIVDARGEFAEPPLATCEVQGYWYAGLQLAASAFLGCGDAAFAARLVRQASQLRDRFNRAFWLDGEDCYAMALGPGGTLADAVSSNPAQLFVTGIVPPERAARLAGRLLRDDMFSGWGIRTLTSQNPAYNPFSYHRGTVWPVEQGTTALGLARYGLTAELHTLTKAFFDLTELFAEARLPEVVGGITRDQEHPHPGIYPYSCAPQGWSASAVVQCVQALLGIHPLAPLNTVVLSPSLPEWLPEVRLEGLQSGPHRLDLHFRRDSRGRTRHTVLSNPGRVRVLRQPAPSTGIQPFRRLRSAAGSLLSAPHLLRR